SIMDGAVLVISATEDVPQAQTEEHLMALDIIGIDNVVIAQNKVDLVDAEGARENYEQIKEFVAGTIAEDAPIVPISAQQEINTDLLIQTLEAEIPTPERDETLPPRMLVARSFDINRPGTTADELLGGVIGGSLAQATLEAGDELEIRPGREVEEGGQSEYVPIETTVRSLQAGNSPVEKVGPG
ncbi:MAG: GTP-binding protein, partial [Halobaculum sp.]